MGLPSSASVATGSFLAWLRCCFGCHRVRRGTAPSAAVLRVVCLGGPLEFLWHNLAGLAGVPFRGWFQAARWSCIR